MQIDWKKTMRRSIYRNQFENDHLTRAFWQSGRNLWVAWLFPAERFFTACRENFYSLPREIFFPAERVKKDRAHPIFGVIYIQGDISRQLAPKGQLSTAQGTALGIRKLRTMRPVRAALTFLCFFTVALTGRVGCLYPFTQGDALGYGWHWAFSPYRLWKILGFLA